MSQLHHPNVVAFYGVVRDGPGGTLATVTEYMVNGSLKQVLQKKDRYYPEKTNMLALAHRVRDYPTISILREFTSSRIPCSHCKKISIL